MSHIVRFAVGLATRTSLIYRLLALALPIASFGGAPAYSQSIDFMLNECSSIGQTYFRDFTARTDMKYNGQRVDGTHAINGRIFLETRYEDFACSYESGGRRMVEFFAEGRVQNAYLPGGSSGGGGQGGGGIFSVTGVAANDVLNVRSGPGTNYRIVGALSNGSSVRNLGCQSVDNSRWCEIEMMTDMRERGWVNGRFLMGGGASHGGAAAQLPNPPPVAGAGQTTTMVVRFPAGATGTELTESLAPGASRRYVLAARNLQNLYFRLAANGPNMSWQIFNPDGSLLDQAQSSKEYRGQLWQSGDHVIEVVNRSSRIQTYNVIFGIN